MSGEPPAEDVLVGTDDGRTLGVSLWGDPGGAPLFWLHGTPGSRRLRHDVEAYRVGRLRVCTYDRPGYGLSTRRLGRTVGQVTDDLRAIADRLGWDTFGVAGVSGGGAHALAAAAGLPGRVRRCAALVTPGPVTAADLDFTGGMDPESQDGWQKALRRDVPALESEWRDILAWVRAGMPGIDVSDRDRTMLAETFDAAGAHGVDGYVDDLLSLSADWGFRLEDVTAPTRVMLARDDTSVPAAHGRWLVSHLPDAQLIWVGGDHFGPRDQPEMGLIRWVGHGGHPGAAPGPDGSGPSA